MIHLGREPGNRGHSLSSAYEKASYPDVRAAIGYRQWRLPSLATATTLVHFEIVTDGVYVLQGGEHVPGEHDRAQQFGHLAIPDSVGLSRGEGEHLHAGGPTVPVSGIYSFLDPTDHLLE